MRLRVNGSARENFMGGWNTVISLPGCNMSEVWEFEPSHCNGWDWAAVAPEVRAGGRGASHP